MKSTVLVVDDDEMLLHSLAEILRSEHYQVITAQNGGTALDVLAKTETPPALILVDLVMPQMDGGSFLRRKAEIESIARIPVLVLTAGRGDVVSPDVVGLLRKPFGIDELLHVVQTVERRVDDTIRIAN